MDKIPIIKVEAEEIKYPDGRVDIIVKVPCLTITSKLNPKGEENGKRDL